MLYAARGGPGGTGPGGQVPGAGQYPPGGRRALFPQYSPATYVQNTGAAFSLLEEHTWILTIVSLVVSVLLVVLLEKKVFPPPLRHGRPVHGAGRGGGAT